MQIFKRPSMVLDLRSETLIAEPSDYRHFRYAEAVIEKRMLSDLALLSDTHNVRF